MALPAVFFDLTFLYGVAIVSDGLGLVPDNTLLSVLNLAGQIAVLVITDKLLKKTAKEDWRTSHYVWLNRTLGLGIIVVLVLGLVAVCVETTFMVSDMQAGKLSIEQVIANMKELINWVSYAICFYILVRLGLKLPLVSKQQPVAHPKSYGI